MAAPGSPPSTIQKDGRDHAIGEVLGEAFDRGTRHAGLVEIGGVAADDMRYCFARRFEVAAFERDRDARDMLVEAPLR